MPREHKRFPLSLEVILNFLSGEREARISDISIEGCFIDTILFVPKGEIFAFKIRLTTGQWLQLKGEVIYCLQNSGFGVRFVDMSEDKERLLLQQIIENS